MWSALVGSSGRGQPGDMNQVLCEVWMGARCSRLGMAWGHPEREGRWKGGQGPARRWHGSGLEVRDKPGGSGSEEVPGERENHGSAPSAKRGPAHSSHVLCLPTIRGAASGEEIGPGQRNGLGLTTRRSGGPWCQWNEQRSHTGPSLGVGGFGKCFCERKLVSLREVWA